MKRILVTGAAGLVGAALLPDLIRIGFELRAACRTRPGGALGCACEVTGTISGATDWCAALEGVDAVVHLASPTHAHFSNAILDEQIVRATSQLAAQAEEAGVQRFVFISSIKAACGRTMGVPVSEKQTPAPEDAYGRAKLAAESLVMARPKLNAIVLRPPLVVAANAKANFAHLMRLARSGLPLPFAAARNRRSLVSLESLVNAIKAALTSGAVGVFHVADTGALSTTEIVTALREGMAAPARLFSAPAAFLPAPLRESLEVDDRAFRRVFGDAWSRDARKALVACGAAWKARR